MSLVFLFVVFPSKEVANKSQTLRIIKLRGDLLRLSIPMCLLKLYQHEYVLGRTVQDCTHFLGNLFECLSSQ